MACINEMAAQSVLHTYTLISGNGIVIRGTGKAFRCVGHLTNGKREKLLLAKMHAFVGISKRKIRINLINSSLDTNGRDRTWNMGMEVNHEQCRGEALCVVTGTGKPIDRLPKQTSIGIDNGGHDEVNARSGKEVKNWIAFSNLLFAHPLFSNEKIQIG